MEKVILGLKNGITNEIKRNKYENALRLISIVSNILYQTNQCYTDDDLEIDLSKLAKLINPLNEITYNENVIMFYDGFGLNNRGLAQIYLKALTRYRKVVYVTDINASKRIPDLKNILANHNMIFLRGKSYLQRINELASIIERFSVSSFFFYSFPNDVVGTVILNAYKGKRYQINLTDHAFWLGARCIDTCIEFRDYGASISKQYRRINKIVKIPFYPVINQNAIFEGYPFEIKGRKVIFSGGALYKTFGGNNNYYRIVDYILDKHKDVIFWYAGEGNTCEINKIISKYPEQAFLTNERNDLYQVLRHSYLYLSTYPICGGLMFQYAAVAGKVPVTLKFDQISDGFLINQEKLNIEFDTYDEVIKELDKLIEDEKYTIDKGESIKNSVIKADDFENAINKLLTSDNSPYEIKYSAINNSKLRKAYKNRISNKSFNSFLVQKNNYIVLKYYPFRFICGFFTKLHNRFLKLYLHK